MSFKKIKISVFTMVFAALLFSFSSAKSQNAPDTYSGLIAAPDNSKNRSSGNVNKVLRPGYNGNDGSQSIGQGKDGKNLKEKEKEKAYNAVIIDPKSKGYEYINLMDEERKKKWREEEAKRELQRLYGN